MPINPLFKQKSYKLSLVKLKVYYGISPTFSPQFSLISPVKYFDSLIEINTLVIQMRKQSPSNQ